MCSNDLEKLPLLFEVFPDFPSIRVMQITDKEPQVVIKVATFLKEKGYGFDVMATDASFLQVLKESIQNPSEYLEIRSLDYDSTKYNYHGKNYDSVFVNVDFEKIKDERYFFERIYATMKNAAGLIVLIPKHSPILEGLVERLEGYNFVAVNPIDLLDEYQVVYAKKMHGWDGAR